MKEWIEREFIEENDRIEIEKELRFLWILWGACLAVLLVLLFFCEAFGEKLRENIKVNSDVPLSLLRTLLLIVGLFSLVLAYFLRRFFLSGKFKGLENGTFKFPSSSNKPSYLVKYRSAIFLPMVIPVTIGFYGFLVYLLGGDSLTLYLFLIISAIGLLYHRPKKEEILDLLDKEKAKQHRS